LPRLLGHGDVEALFTTAEQEAASDRPEPLRLLALLEMLYGSGLRATELVSLPVSAVPRDAPLLTLVGKVGCRAWCRCPRGRGMCCHAGWRCGGTVGAVIRAFSSLRAGGHLTRIRLFQLLRDLAVRAGLDPAVSRPMCCAMPLPPICWKAARICAFCR
jgi:integrase/recombinase XerD